MTAKAWVDARVPSPPPRLAERLEELLSGTDVGPPEGFLDVAVASLERLLREGSEARDAALDLLSADALVTYAFELACDEPDLLDGRASTALARLARLGGGGA
jgi:hypothetical protein